MENLSLLSQKVLQYNEPDCSKWMQWLSHQDLYPVSQSECMLEFVSMMALAKQRQWKVLVAGDYDCDGIMATTIMVSGLKKYGLDCGFYIPDRLKEGYGLHAHTVEMAHEKGYKIILTVDNGIKAFEALQKAQELNMVTIVTDHHTIEEYVKADVLVHPDEMEEEFSSLCGAGIAFECMRALGMANAFHLMCACVASIGDMMPVIKQTRWIIQKGIQALNQSHEHHFFSLTKDETLNENSIAFQIVPKLNAIGRLSDLANVNNAVRYFLSKQQNLSFVSQIEALNNKRKEMSQQMTLDALHRCDLKDDILFVYNEHYHEGIVGLVSGQMNAQYEKPVIVSTSSNGLTRCSMRAPAGFNCVEFLRDFDGFETMGGHKQAAGFSFLNENLHSFQMYIEEKIKSYVWQKEEKNSIEVQVNELSVSEVKSLDVLRPFGPGFELPIFKINNPDIKSIFDFQNGKHRKYILDQGLQCMDFNQTKEHFINRNKPIQSLSGTISINRFRQKDTVNLTIDSIKYKEM